MQTANKLHKLDKLLLYMMSIVVVVLAIYTVSTVLSKKEVAYIDISKLTEDYELKKDLENIASQNLYKIRGAIDSLKMLQKLASTNNGRVDSQLLHAEQVFNEYYAQSNQEINKKIWERLNPLIEEYGNEKKLTLLIGANGAGSLLYADKGRDLTADLTAYVNRKYAKGN